VEDLRSQLAVYNYFQTKEQLVIDRDQQVQDRLVELIRARPPGVSPAAIRDLVLATVEGIPSISPQLWRGELGYLAVISPTIHRLSLGMTRPSRRHRRRNQRHHARPDRGGQATRDRHRQRVSNHPQPRRPRHLRRAPQTEIADELYPIIEAVLDELDRWFTTDHG
jgi:AcrR family transcriptional regulator